MQCVLVKIEMGKREGGKNDFSLFRQAAARMKRRMWQQRPTRSDGRLWESTKGAHRGWFRQGGAFREGNAGGRPLLIQPKRQEGAKLVERKFHVST